MVELSESERVELLAMLNSTTVSARVATRARIVLWRAEGWLKKDVASRAGVSRRPSMRHSSASQPVV